MKIKKIRRADDDLRSIFRYTLDTWGESQAEAYRQELDRVFTLIGEQPARVVLTKDGPGSSCTANTSSSIGWNAMSWSSAEFCTAHANAADDAEPDPYRSCLARHPALWQFPRHTCAHIAQG